VTITRDLTTGELRRVEDRKHSLVKSDAGAWSCKACGEELPDWKGGDDV